jgi:Fe-S-cluster containining protein
VVQAVNPKASVSLISKSQNPCNINACHSECCRHIALKVANSGADFEKYAMNHGITVKPAEKGMSWVRLPLACKELDESGVCKSYNARPDLCRGYPAIGSSPFIEKAVCSLATIDKALDVLQKTVEKRGNQWCVVHCHGPEAGTAIKCFDTKEEADEMHAAIQANKATASEIDELTLEVESILQKHGFNKVK